MSGATWRDVRAGTRWARVNPHEPRLVLTVITPPRSAHADVELFRGTAKNNRVRLTVSDLLHRFAPTRAAAPAPEGRADG